MSDAELVDSLTVGRNFTGHNASGIAKLETDEMHFDTGLSSFMLLATAMVQLMTPGLAMFYSGLVGADSVVNVILQNFSCMGIVFLSWVVFGFSLTFGVPWISFGDVSFLGNPATFFMFKGVDVYEPLQKADSIVAAGFPGILFACYQGMFAVISPAIISGAFTDRLRLFPYQLFVVLWIVLVYCPVGFWNWGGGWMFELGAWDFAGGIVVHETAGFASLGAVIFLGNRALREGENVHHMKKPHNLPLVALGTAVLWFGWIGFNSGSAMAIGGLAGIAFTNTLLCPAVAMTLWMALERILTGKATLLGCCSGILSGLVVITPSAGFVQISLSIPMGFIGASVCYVAVKTVEKLDLDDAVDAFAIHGVGGLCGTLMVGIFADPSACQDEKTSPEWCANPGTVARSFHQTMVQLLCGLSAGMYSLIVTMIILKFMQLMHIAPILSHAEQQHALKDHEQHGESAYFHPAFASLPREAAGKSVGCVHNQSLADLPPTC